MPTPPSTFLRRALLGLLVTASLGFSACGIRDAMVQRELQKAAADINKTCPKQVDSATRLDKATVGPGRTLNYFYTVTALASQDVTPEVKERFEKVARPEVLGSLRGNAEVAPLHQNGITLVFIYNAKDGGEFARFTFAPAEYAK